MPHLFIETLQSDPLLFVSVIFTVIISIVLHELAHGVAAIWQGDDTPLRLNRMTLNPMVHMGAFSIILLLMMGIAWGMMPVNPARFRSRYGAAFVAAAGPVTNLLLAALALITLGLWQRFGTTDATQLAQNAALFLWIFGTTNLVLCLFNLIPIPPLDGSSILANFSRGYMDLIHGPKREMFFVGIFLAFFFFGGQLWGVAYSVGAQFLVLMNGGL